MADRDIWSEFYFPELEENYLELRRSGDGHRVVFLRALVCDGGGRGVPHSENINLVQFLSRSDIKDSTEKMVDSSHESGACRKSSFKIQSISNSSR